MKSPTDTTLHPMSHVDRMWLRMDHPTNLMMITGVTFFDEPVERQAIAEVLRSRLLAIPRFSWRVVIAKGRSGHRWEPVPEPDLDWHLQEVALPEPGDDEALQSFVNAWISEPLSLDRPLWQVHLIQNHKRGSALLWRLHHCIGDGIALMLAMLSLTDLPPSVGEREENRPFVSLDIRILSGRDDQTKAMLSESALKILKKTFSQSVSQMNCSLTVQISDLHRQSYARSGNRP